MTKLRLLLDTHTWIWAMDGSKLLPREHARFIEDPSNEVFVSAISVWEAAIKASLGKLRVRGDLVTRAGQDGYEFLDFTLSAAVAVGSLPLHHRDPFDRALLAQAKVENLTLITSDAAFLVYSKEIDLHIITH